MAPPSVANFCLTLALLVALFSVACARQKPERHFGCPPGKNVCIYPIGDANLQCETIFDFQVSLDLKDDESRSDIPRSEISIQITTPSGNTVKPEDLFGKQPEYRTWKIEAFEDSADEAPKGYNSYTWTWRNVIIPKDMGYGGMEVTVVARGVTTVANWVIREPKKRRAKNVVLFIGDGMALPLMAGTFWLF